MITHEESKAMNIAPRGRIKIVAKKVWENGEPLYEVTHIEAASISNLPRSYLSNTPHCYSYGGGNLLHLRGKLHNEIVSVDIKVGSRYTIRQYTDYLEIVKQAGEHLKELLELYQSVYYKGWSGDQVDII